MGTYVLRNAVEIRLKERGQCALAAAWRADKDEDALLLGRGAGDSCRNCVMFHKEFVFFFELEPS